MDTILLAGVESVVGANLAARLAERFRVVGVSFGGAVAIDGCETATCGGDARETAREWTAAVAPSRIVFCGTEADSAWQPAHTRPERRVAADAVRRWAEAARDAGSRFVLVSSDAVFTGPWLFHEEDSPAACPSPTADAIRATERLVASIDPEALIVRTHAFGWSPAQADDGRDGWIEWLLSELEHETAGPFDSRRHATPIHATQLAEILERAFQEELTGLHHVAGSERVNQARFVERLAEEFDLPSPRRVQPDPTDGRPVGFGCGETSLHTLRVRRALCVAMPTLAEGLRQLHRERIDGWRDRLSQPQTEYRERVA